MRDIPGYEGLYAATEDGRIWSHRGGLFLKPALIRKGYERVNLWRDCAYLTKLVHRLVLETFDPMPSPNSQANHRDGCKRNNHRINLEWVSGSENMSHAYNNALSANCGQTHRFAKLSDDDVRKIRSDVGRPKTEIAMDYGVHPSVISRIHGGKAWKQLCA